MAEEVREMTEAFGPLVMVGLEGSSATGEVGASNGFLLLFLENRELFLLNKLLVEEPADGGDWPVIIAEDGLKSGVDLQTAGLPTKVAQIDSAFH